MKEEIKELRVSIDGLAQLVKPMVVVQGVDIHGVKLKFQSIEIGETYKSLILAKAWLGKVLQELGESTPYANDGSRKSVEDIEPVADKATNLFEISNFLEYWGKDFNNLFHIEKVDWLRCSVEDLIQEVIKLDLKGTRELAIARTNSYTHLCESKIYLGLELGRIRDSK